MSGPCPEIVPTSVPVWDFSVRFLSAAETWSSATSCLGDKSLVTYGSLISTGPDEDRVTGSQMPVSRSRTAGSQSQPMVERNVGPSIAVSPPFLPTPAATVCSCGTPGWGCGDTRTARAAARPDFTSVVTSKSPRMNAPRIVPTC